MESNRFDAYTRLVGKVGTRRLFLRAVKAGVLAAGLARFGAADVAADCKKTGQKCEKDNDCCKDGRCKRGKCVCKPGLQHCGKACCPDGVVCVVGKETETCCSAAKVCGKTCCPVDRVCVCPKPPPFGPAPDPDQSCYCRCADGYKEDRNGECICPAKCGNDCCESNVGERCCFIDGEYLCVLTSSSNNNCGACGHVCPKDRLCVGGECACPPGYLDCGKTCVPKNLPHGGTGCCTDAECGDGDGFCCNDAPTASCGGGGACGLPNQCVACV